MRRRRFWLKLVIYMMLIAMVLSTLLYAFEAFLL